MGFLNPLWAGVIVFLIAMAESLAIVGVLVPGVVMMFGIGALIATGVLEFWPTFAWAVTGAVAGDGLSFFLGRFYQQQLTGIWPFTRYPQMLDRGVRFFERYGGKSVVFGRFVGPVRAVDPPGGGHDGYAIGSFPGRQYRVCAGLGARLPAARYGIRRVAGAGL